MIKQYQIENTKYFFDGDTLNLYQDEIITKRDAKREEVSESENLYVVTFFMTDQCNGRCKYCYEEHGSSRMCKEGADRAISTLKRKYKRINRGRFFGGEPLINFEMIKYIVNELSGEFCVDSWEITTNAVLIQDDILNFLVQHDFKIVVSFDGPDFIHNYLRPGCNQENILKCIENIQKTSIGDKLELNCTYTQYHKEKIGLENLKQYLDGLGVKYTITSVITDIKGLKIENTKNDYKEAIDASYKRLEEKCLNIGVNTFVSSVINAVVKRKYHNEFCYELRAGMAFDMDGREYSCTRLIKKCQPNDKEILEANSKNNKICNGCWARGMCFYCAANIYTKEIIPYIAAECELKKGYDYALEKFIQYLHKAPETLQKIVDNFYD